MREHSGMAFVSIAVGLGSLLVWDALGPFAGVLCTVGAFYLGAMVSMILWKRSPR